MKLSLVREVLCNLQPVELKTAAMREIQGGQTSGMIQASQMSYCPCLRPYPNGGKDMKKFFTTKQVGVEHGIYD